MDITWRDFSGKREGRSGREGKGEGRSIIGRHKIRWGEVKNGIGNRELKELICTTHGHELRVGECWRVGGYRAEGG